MFGQAILERLCVSSRSRETSPVPGPAERCRESDSRTPFRPAGTPNALLKLKVDPVQRPAKLPGAHQKTCDLTISEKLFKHSKVKSCS